MSVLDVFTQDPFSVISLTNAINNVPFIPGRAGAVARWQEVNVATTSIMLEEISGTLDFINPTERGGPGSAFGKEKRTARLLRIPHYQIDDAINADEVQGVRAFGQESVVETIREMVDMRLMQHSQLRLDPTLEYQRIGAIKGVILNGDGSTLYNLFTEFGVSQEGEQDFDLDNANPTAGVLRKKCTEVVRLVATNLGGAAYESIYAFCGDAFWDDLIAHTEVRASYLAQQEAPQLRAGVAYGAFNFGGITFENYRGAVGGSAFVDTNKCHIFPVGVAGLFNTVYGPGDHNDTVNSLGVPRYARQREKADGKGITIEVQMNALNYCTRPKALILGKRT